MQFLDLNCNMTHSNTKIQKWHEINEKKPKSCLYHLIYPCYKVQYEFALEKYLGLKMSAQSG